MDFKFVDQLVAKSEFKQLMKQLNENNLNFSQVAQILDFVKNHDEFKSDLLNLTIKKACEQRKGDFILDIMKQFRDFREVGDSAIRSLKDPELSCKTIEAGVSVKPQEHWKIVLESENVESMLNLCLVIQNKNLSNLNYMKLEDRAIEIASKDHMKETEQRRMIAQFIRYISESKESEIKDKIVQDVLLKYDYVSYGQLQDIYDIEPKILTANEFASYVLDHNTLADVKFLQKYYKDITSDEIKQRFASLVNEDGKFVDVALNVMEPELLDAHKIAEKMIEKRNYSIFSKLVKLPGADGKKLEQAVLKSKNFKALHDFALAYKESDLEKIISRMKEIHSSTRIYRAEEISDTAVDNFMNYNESFISSHYGAFAYQLSREEARQELMDKEIRKMNDSIKAFEERELLIEEVVLEKDKREKSDNKTKSQKQLKEFNSSKEQKRDL